MLAAVLAMPVQAVLTRSKASALTSLPDMVLFSRASRYGWYSVATRELE